MVLHRRPPHAFRASYHSFKRNSFRHHFGIGFAPNVFIFFSSRMPSIDFCNTGPVLDPAEFSARFLAHVKGVHSLGNEGGLLAMILVVWAASFGLDERGLPDTEGSDIATPESDVTPVSGRRSAKGNEYGSSEGKPREASLERKRKEKKENTEAMLREVLELVDFHGVMRRPTWDGVRVLLLILPLMEGE